MDDEELLEKYGEIPVVFNSYYKYHFYFASEDNKLWVDAGGDSSEIYRLKVISGKKYFISDLPICTVSWEGKEIYREI